MSIPREFTADHCDLCRALRKRAERAEAAQLEARLQEIAERWRLPIGQRVQVIRRKP